MNERNGILPFPDAEARKKRRDRFFLILAFLLPFASVMLVRFLMLTTGENSLDGFYHAGMAKLGPEVILGREFPWTDMSVWRDTFADKEMLYHLSLWVLFRIEMLFGIDPQPPFHFAAGFYLVLLCGSFVFAGVRFGVRPALLAAGSLLFSVITPNWTYRMIMLRPHILSIACILFACGILAGGSFRRRLLLMTVFSFFYSWTYSNPHFIVIPVLFFALCGIRTDGWKSLFLPVFSLAAVLLGLLIHPQFPNSFRIWKLQSFDALFTPMMSSNYLPKPNEMMSPSFGWFLTVIPLMILLYLSLLMLIRILERRGIRGFEPPVLAFALLTFLFSGGIFLAMRSIEYAAPLGALLFLILYDRAEKENFSLPFRRWKIPGAALWIIFLFSLSVGSYSVVRCVEDGRHNQNRPVRAMAQWMRENLKPGDHVVNLDWSDFPILFYSDPDRLYQWGLDPIFAYAVQPRKALLLTQTRFTDSKIPLPREIFREFGCRYAVLLFPRVPHASLLTKNGWKLVHEFQVPDGRVEGWIFALDEREAAHLPRIEIVPLDEKYKK